MNVIVSGHVKVAVGNFGNVLVGERDRIVKTMRNY
jgi:hypothetical protein